MKRTIFFGWLAACSLCGELLEYTRNCPVPRRCHRHRHLRQRGWFDRQSHRTHWPLAERRHARHPASDTHVHQPDGGFHFGRLRLRARNSGCRRLGRLQPHHRPDGGVESAHGGNRPPVRDDVVVARARACSNCRWRRGPDSRSCGRPSRPPHHLLLHHRRRRHQADPTPASGLHSPPPAACASGGIRLRRRGRRAFRRMGVCAAGAASAATGSRDRSLRPVVVRPELEDDSGGSWRACLQLLRLRPERRHDVPRGHRRSTAAAASST